MSGICCTYEVEERCIEGFDTGNMKEEDYLEDLGVEWRIALKSIYKE
jgi:hypothetical protein